MEINSLLFPAPPPSYTISEFGEEMIWVPKASKSLSIPCLLLKSEKESNKIMLFFHANAEDLKLAYELIDLLRTVLHINVLAIEYPGFGLYKYKTTSKTILEDAECVYDFTRSKLGFSCRNIYVFGRSIGTGPATHLARYKKVGCLFLMSAFTSIKALVKQLAGKLSVMVKERFNNIENIKHITCPTFIVHGKKDKLIPYEHSQMLQEVCGGPCSLFIPPEMDHDSFDYCDDLALPISAFLLQSRINLENPNSNNFPVSLRVSPDMYNPNPAQKLRLKGGRFYNLLKKVF
jgi:abhydrolase domain-containing protein 17